MAQIIKLRRSAVAGNVPTTSQLGLGELAINTADGKIYFEKNDGSPTIQTIVTTDSQTVGSIEITGNISGSLTSTGSFGVGSITTKAAIGGLANLNQSYTLFVKDTTTANNTWAGYFMNSWANSGGGGIYIQNNGNNTTQTLNSNDTFIVTKDGSASGSAASTGSC